jgi:hypothetical protein
VSFEDFKVIDIAGINGMMLRRKKMRVREYPGVKLV